MNVSLYNALVNAYNFFINDEKKREEIKKCEGNLFVHKYEHSMHIPVFQEEPISWTDAILWLLICFPIGLIYILSNKIKNNKNRKKYEKNKQKLLNTPAEIEYRSNKKKAITEAEIALEQARQARDMYYRNNYEKCLSFLPKGYRNKEDIEALIHYVKSGLANSLDTACSLRAESIREINESRMHEYEKMDQERRHRETQEALETIARNQEKTNHELEIANGYRTGRYRH